MSTEAQSLTLAELNALAQQYAQLPNRRETPELIISATGWPTAATDRGLASIDALARLYREHGGLSQPPWHYAISADGQIWAGRDLADPPGLPAHHRGNNQVGPVYIELIGDLEHTAQTAAQVQTLAQVLHLLAVALRVVPAPPAGAVIALPNLRPGYAIGLYSDGRLDSLVHDNNRAVWQKWFLGQIAAPVLVPALTEGALTQLKARHARAAVARSADEPRLPRLDPAGYGETLNRLALESAQSRAGRRGHIDCDPNPVVLPREMYAGHIVNLARGVLSTGGKFSTPNLNQLIGRFDFEADQALTANRPLRVLLWAHGGLVSESNALAEAARMAPWWGREGVHAIYFVWETGLWDLLRHSMGARDLGQRDLTDWLIDIPLEKLTGPLGRAAWGQMKDDAQSASESWVAKEQQPGGAYLFARAFADWLARRLKQDTRLEVELSACGHSAGAIFQAHFLPVLHRTLDDRKLQVPFKLLGLLAGAARCDLYQQNLAPLITNWPVERVTLFNLDDQRERDDTAGPYRKSLLYLVRRAYESPRPADLIGMQIGLQGSGLATAPGAANGRPFRPGTVNAVDRTAYELYYSAGRRSPADAPTRAEIHGGFNNDPATLKSLLVRIRGLPIGTDFQTAKVPCEPGATRELADAASPSGPTTAHQAYAADDRIVHSPAGAGRKRALCVGIDNYERIPLSGCRNDAARWAQVLGQLGFETQVLPEQRATRVGLLAALKALLADARRGDVLVFQFSGHGTQFADRTGDEDDGLDEAFVCYDHLRDGYLLDDDIGELGAKVPAGVNFTMFIDCCHSGSIHRVAAAPAPGDAVARFLPATAEMQAAYERQVAGRPRAVSLLGGGGPRLLHLAACKDNQYAYESGGMGHYTRSATAALIDSVQRRFRPAAFLRRVLQGMTGLAQQTPQLTAAAPELERHPLLAPLR